MLKGIVIGPMPIHFVWSEADPVTMDFGSIGSLSPSPRGKTLKMKFTLPDDSQIAFVLPKAGKDARGNAVPLKTPPTVSVSDPTILTLVSRTRPPPNDAASRLIVAAGALGTAQLASRTRMNPPSP